MGYILTKSWHLPEEISQAIRYHHDGSILKDAAAKLPDASKNLIALGLLANHALSQQAEQAASREWVCDGVLALSHLGVAAEEFADIVADVKIMLE